MSGEKSSGVASPKPEMLVCKAKHKASFLGFFLCYQVERMRPFDGENEGLNVDHWKRL